MAAVAAFVMPHFARDPERTEPHLRAALDGLLAQTDEAWHLYVVDDASPHPDALPLLRERVAALGDQATVVALPENRGAGYARNVGVALAADAGAPFVSYNDADDVSPAERLETVRATFDGDPEVTVTFGGWRCIDDRGLAIPRDRLVPHLQRMLGELERLPRRIEDAFVLMATQVGFFMLTSSTSVRTDVARAHPWPSEYSVEDLHTWYRYLAHGGGVVFHPELLAGYRVTGDNAGSESAERYGGASSFWDKLNRLEVDGFTRALDIAVARGIVDGEERHRVAAAFHERTAEVWRLCEQPALREESLRLAEDHRRLVRAGAVATG